jgi:hypothetical protein
MHSLSKHIVIHFRNTLLCQQLFSRSAQTKKGHKIQDNQKHKTNIIHRTTKFIVHLAVKVTIHPVLKLHAF